MTLQFRRLRRTPSTGNAGLGRKTFTLRKLVNAIRPANLHDAIDTGVPNGRESW